MGAASGGQADGGGEEAVVIGERPSWQAAGACRNVAPEVFFPVRGQNATEAKDVCLGCRVRGECLEYAIENRIRIGVWGGLVERERRRRRRLRSAQALARREQAAA